MSWDSSWLWLHFQGRKNPHLNPSQNFRDFDKKRKYTDAMCLYHIGDYDKLETLKLKFITTKHKENHLHTLMCTIAAWSIGNFSHYKLVHLR